MNPEIEAIDKEIVRLQDLRASMVAEAVKKKADLLCAEMGKRRAK